MHKIDHCELSDKYIGLFNEFLDEIESPLHVGNITCSAVFGGYRIILEDYSGNSFWYSEYYVPDMPIQLALSTAFSSFCKQMRPVMKNVVLTSYGQKLVSRRIQGDVTDRIKCELYAQALEELLGDCKIDVITEE